MLLSGLAVAGTLHGQAETLATTGLPPANVLVLVDRSADTARACGSRTCAEAMEDALHRVIGHHDELWWGLAGTSDAPDLDRFHPLAALGTTTEELVATSLEPLGATRNLGESVASLARAYLRTVPGEGKEAGFAGAPIDFAAQQTHVVVLTTGGPTHDDVSLEEAARLLRQDLRPDLDGEQLARLHVIGLALDEEQPELAAAAELAAGSYREASDRDTLVAALLELLLELRDEHGVQSWQVLASEDEHLLSAWFEAVPGDPLLHGHLDRWPAELDEASTPSWDAAELLADRPVWPGEYNGHDRDGFGRRDLYTFVPELAWQSTSSAWQAAQHQRMSFDHVLVRSLAQSDQLDLVVDTSRDGAGLGDDAWDLDGDGWIGWTDAQHLVDFVRGAPATRYRFLDATRGTARLGDDPRSAPAIVTPRRDTYALDGSYRAFLARLEAEDLPTVAYVATNAGLLHCIQVEDGPATTASTWSEQDEAGQELWAWVPASVLYREPVVEGAGRLVEQLWYGRTRLLEGTPVVDDVWIDADGDGASAPDGSEWHRVVVVQQGRGGPATLALDVTDPRDPRFLWERIDPHEPTALGATSSRPGVVTVEDARGDQLAWRHVVLSTSGAAPAASISATRREQAEAALYTWDVGDTWWTLPSPTLATFGFQGGTFEAGGATLLDSWGAMPGAVTAVDVDGDGAVETLYLPVTSTEPVDGEEHARTWIQKAVLDPASPDTPTWCDPFDPASLVGEAELALAGTASWRTDGALGLYFATGSPDALDPDGQEHLIALVDPDPSTCVALAPEPRCGDGGAYALSPGERPVAEPVVIDGTVWLATWLPDAHEGGHETRLYGLADGTCTGQHDSDGDGEPDASWTAIGGPSNLTLSDRGVLYWSNAPEPAPAGLPVVTEHARVQGMTRRFVF